MRRKIIIFTCILIAAAAMLELYTDVPAVQEKIASYTEEDFTQENIYSDLESLALRLDEEILNGEDYFTVYLKDMDVDEINQINSSLNGIFGSGETYQEIGSVGEHYKKVRITMKRTVNYDVLVAYRDGAALPENDSEAEKLYEAVSNILQTVVTDGMSDYDKELAIHDYLVANCSYSSDTTQDSDSDIYRAYGALVNRDAVCNGYAEAMQLLLMCENIQVKFVVGTADEVDHAWNMVELDGNWYHVDVTWDDPVPDQGDNVLHPYFNVTDEIMAAQHEWERDDYPQATHMEENYYVKSQSYFTSFDEYKGKAYEVMVSHGKRRYEAVIEGYTETEDDMQFLFDGNYRYSSISWQTFGDGMYHVLVLNAQ